MGAIECEVKVLNENRPLLFTWENQAKKTVECLLVTCPCQKLDLENKGSGPSGKEDGEWVKKLVRSLEKSEVCSLGTSNLCESLANHVNLRDNLRDVTPGKENLKGLSRRRRDKHRRKLLRKLSRKSKRQQKRSAAESSEGAADHQYVKKEGGVDESAWLDPNEEHDSYGNDDGEISAAGGSNNDQSFAGDAVERDDSECGNTDQTDQTDLVEAGTPMETSRNAETFQSIYPCEDQTDLLGVTQDGEMTDVVGGESEVQPIPLNREEYTELPVPPRSVVNEVPRPIEIVMDSGNTQLENDTVDIVPLESVLPSNLQPSSDATSLPIESALMKAIDSIMVMQMTPAAEENLVSQIISEQEFDPQPELVTRPCDPDAPPTDVKFIRALTEAERQKMFSFKSDREKKNFKGLQESHKGVFLCEYCGKVLASSTKKNHMMTHFERERNFLCNECGKGFATVNGLNNHIKTHDPNRGHQCRYCPKTYKTVFGRTMHERLHFGVYPCSCAKCGRKFSDNRVMRNHVEICRGPNAKKVRRIRRQLSPPSPPRNGEGFVTCPICSKVLRTGSYRPHMDMHQGRMFTCPTCGKVMKFSSRSSHLKRHSPTRDHGCNYCGKMFKNKQGLAAHVRVHTGEKPHKCRYCERSFSRYSSREVHESTHTNARPYRCHICDKTWKDRSSYWLHMKKKHPGEPLSYKRLTAEINSKQGLNFFVDNSGGQNVVGTIDEALQQEVIVSDV